MSFDQNISKVKRRRKHFNKGEKKEKARTKNEKKAIKLRLQRATKSYLSVGGLQKPKVLGTNKSKATNAISFGLQAK
jgi:hypothetical protein